MLSMLSRSDCSSAASSSVMLRPYGPLVACPDDLRERDDDGCRTRPAGRPGPRPDPRSDRVAELGCLLYEVGTDADAPDTVFVLELWRNAAAHRASLHDPGVHAAIEEARPLLAGRFGGFHFDVAGSPLRD